MIDKLLRGVVLLWALAFGFIGIQGLFASAPYLDLMGPITSPTGINTARADLSAFFLVSAAFALIGVLRAGAAQALIVPAALFGTAMTGRIIGLVLGDEPTAQVTQAIMAEGISLLLMLLTLRQLSRSAPVS